MLVKRNLIFLSLFILVVLLLSSCFLNPPATEGILKGQIMVPEGTLKTKDLIGQALPDATVNIIDLETGAIIATTVTDAEGYYQVSVPPGGPYLLQAVKDGVKLLQFTPQVEVGIEYDLGKADCVTTASALIAQMMMDAGDNLSDIDGDAIIADPNFDDVSSIVCSTIQAGEDPTVSAAVLQAVEDFLNPPEPAPAPEPTPSPTTINISAIPGVTVPEVGATPVTTITATAQYTGTVTWAPTDNPFAAETAYTATISLTAKAGFTLTGVTENFFTVAGATADTNAADSGVVTAVFPATAAAVIDIAAIPGETAPVIGATPVGTITATAQYTGTVAWTPADDPFQGRKVYVATITLTAKAGFTLTGVAANFFTVAGATIITNTTDSGVVTAIFPETLKVGDSYGGGILAYILQSGDPGYVAGEQHGLIAATADQSTGIQWHNGAYVVTGATGTEIGTGQANTTAIVTIQGAGSYAAQLCNDLTAGGHNDWFLPSKDELNLMYDNLHNIDTPVGGFDARFYWSSSETNVYSAWAQPFGSGGQFYDDKSGTDRVRAVRAF